MSIFFVITRRLSALTCMAVACACGSDASAPSGGGSAAQGPSEAEQRSAQSGVDAASDASDTADASSGSAARAATVSVSTSSNIPNTTSSGTASTTTSNNQTTTTVTTGSGDQAQLISSTAQSPGLGKGLPAARAKCLRSAHAAGLAVSTEVATKLAAGVSFGSGLTLGGLSQSGSASIIADANAHTVLDFSAPACKVGRRAIAGEAVLNTIAVSADESVTEVVADLTFTTGSAQVTVTSVDKSKPTYKLTTRTMSSTQQQRSIALNEHRTRKVGGKVVFDINVLTGDGNQLVVLDDKVAVAADDTATTGQTQTAVASRTLVQGQQVTEHLQAEFISSHTFDNLVIPIAQGCRCPASGSLTQKVTFKNGDTATHTYTFTACGQANVSSQLVKSKVQSQSTGTISWDECQG